MTQWERDISQSSAVLWTNPRWARLPLRPFKPINQSFVEVIVIWGVSCPLDQMPKKRRAELMSQEKMCVIPIQRQLPLPL